MRPKRGGWPTLGLYYAREEGCPAKLFRRRRRRHVTLEVEASILRLLRDIGSNNAGAFLARWTPEEIIEDLTAVIVAVNEDYYNCIKNPAGMLWDNLEARFPKGRGR